MRSLLTFVLALEISWAMAQTSGNEIEPAGMKPGIIVNGISWCKIGHGNQSCTPRTCDSIYVAAGDTVSFCTDNDVDLTSDTIYYMQWNFNGSNFTSPVMDYVPTATPFCHYPVWNTPGTYIVDVYYNGWLSAYPDRDCWSYGPSHWITKIFVYPSVSGLGSQNTAGDQPAFYPNPCQDQVTLDLPKGTRGLLLVYSSIGSNVKEVPLSDDLKTISVADLPRGIYYCRVLVSGNSILAEKLVIAR